MWLNSNQYIYILKSVEHKYMTKLKYMCIINNNKCKKTLLSLLEIESFCFLIKYESKTQINYMKIQNNVT